MIKLGTHTVKVKKAKWGSYYATDSAQMIKGRNKNVKFTVKSGDKYYKEIADELFVAGSGKGRIAAFVADVDASIKRNKISGKGIQEHFHPYPYYAEWVGKGTVVIKKERKKR